MFLVTDRKQRSEDVEELEHKGGNVSMFLVLRMNTCVKIALECHFFAPRPLEVKKWEWLAERAWSKTFRFIDPKAKLDLIFCH